MVPLLLTLAACGDGPSGASSAATPDPAAPWSEATSDATEAAATGTEADPGNSVPGGPSTRPTPSGVTADTGFTAQGADTGSSCAYPAGAVEPMALGEVLTPYRWPQAGSFAGAMAELDLADAPCAAPGDIDWSPFDVLVFISIPAW